MTVDTNVYDALDGRPQRRPFEAPMELAVGDVVVMKPMRRETQTHAALRKAVEARQKVTSPAAVQRHDANLADLGLPVPLHGISIDHTRVVHLPAYVGLLQGPQDRVVAVDGISGQLDEVMSRTLTGRLAHLRAAFT